MNQTRIHQLTLSITLVETRTHPYLIELVTVES